MNTYPQTMAGDTFQSCCRDDFLQQLETCVCALGFTYFSYFVFSGYPMSRPKVAIESNYPPQYIKEYNKNRIYLLDPVIEQAHHSTIHFLWNKEFYHDQPDIWLRMMQFGIHEGWTQSVKDCHGRVGILTFAGEKIPQQTDTLKICDEIFFLWLAQTAHKTLREQLLSDNDDTIRDVLTLREKIILRWCSEGKTAEEIAILMELSERTVNFHISNSIKKLSVSNKTAATAKAAYLQLI